MYDILYSKEALNIYTFLFANKNIEFKKEQKIKNLLYAIYMYNIQYMNEKSIENLKIFISKIGDVKELDYMLVQNVSMMYELYPIHEAIKNHNILEEYQECFLNLQQHIMDIDIGALEYLLKQKIK